MMFLQTQSAPGYTFQIDPIDRPTHGVILGSTLDGMSSSQPWTLMSPPELAVARLLLSYVSPLPATFMTLLPDQDAQREKRLANEQRSRRWRRINSRPS